MHPDNCLILLVKVLLFVRASKRIQISSSSFSELKMIKCLKNGLKILTISLLAQVLRMKYYKCFKSTAWYSK